MILFALCASLVLLCQFAITSGGSHFLLDVNDSCLERECGPRVSKCMLIGACNCSITAEKLRHKQCPCCRECIKCLGEMLTDCCPCIGLCKPHNEKPTELHLRSSIQELNVNEDFPGIFEEQFAQLELDWRTYVFPVKQELNKYKQIKELNNILGSPESTNCTLIYMNECMSHKRCEQTCKTMGASSLRWFHTGCCQCIGSFCLKYGSDKDRCNDCKSSSSPNEESDEDKIIDQNRSHVTYENDQEL